MIEVYAFVAAFTVQILAVSVLYPIWFIRYWRAQAKSVPIERLAQLYPDVDFNLAEKRFSARYRAVNAGVAVLGLLLLAWLFGYMRRQNWEDGPVKAVVSVYFIVQFFLPLSLVVWSRIKFKVHQGSLLEAKRKATLQRRELFDFVSPFVVFLAVLVYFLFAAFVLWIQQRPFPAFAGLINIGVVTLVYVLNASVVYAVLYGKKPNPFEAPADRVQMIGLTVKSCVYSCIACVVFLSLDFTLVLLNVQRWEPFALSIFFVACTFLCPLGLSAPPRHPPANQPMPGWQGS